MGGAQPGGCECQPAYGWGGGRGEGRKGADERAGIEVQVRLLALLKDVMIFYMEDISNGRFIDR